MWSMGSYGVVAFTCVRRGGGGVRPGSMDSLARALGVVWFIQDRSVHSRGTFGLYGVIAFTRTCPGCRYVHLVSLRSFAHAQVVIGFTRSRPGSCLVDLVSLISLARAMRVFGFIMGRWVLSRTS